MGTRIRFARQRGERCGNNIGIRVHEGPFLDIGDDTVTPSGMLFTVEPGLYVEGLAGFRYTILVTEHEPEYH